MKRTLTGLAIAAATLATADAAKAQPAVGLLSDTSGNAIATFDTTSPGTYTGARAVTGLVADERLVGIDYRWIPAAAAVGATPGLYGLGVSSDTGNSHIYKIDIATAVASPVGAGFNRALTSSYGFDFNPSVDRIRVIGSNDDSFRAHPDTGAFVAADTTLTPAGQTISAVAYDRVNVAPAVAPAASPTTLYAINPTTDQLVTIGGVSSVPSPNGGVLNSVGPLGVDALSGSESNLDIAPDGTAYATLEVGGLQGLYTVNLTSGAVSLTGRTAQVLTGLAVVPAPVVPTPIPPVIPVPTPTPDTTAPTTTISLRSSYSMKAFKAGITVKVTTNELASVEGTLNAKVTKATAARVALAGTYNLELVGKKLSTGSGTRSLKLKPKAKLFGSPRKSVKVKVRVIATDTAGNDRTVTKIITVKK
jgi:hypothetical protein